MKPAPFQYFAPREVNEALDLLKQFGEEAKILAGGQSLMPLLSLRLARPQVIIDINRISGLDSISAGKNGALTIGALTRHRAVERSKTVQDRNPLLAATMPLIGHFQIRNRGTLGGSLVHADPAAELPAVAIALGMEFVLRSAQGERVVPSEDFFLGYMATAVEPSELLTEIRIPSWKPRTGWAIDEVSRRKGDFAMVGVAVLVQLDGDAFRDSCIVIFGVGGKPVRMREAEGMLKGKKLGRQTFTDIGEAVANDLEPDSDIHASAQYRKEVGGVLTRRSLETALARAKESGRK
jgi:carbon-monoxide dehydrogenase medium subunit